MPQMTIFECQKDKNMTRVKNKVINVKVVLKFKIRNVSINILVVYIPPATPVFVYSHFF
jgi:hypothetical protein